MESEEHVDKTYWGHCFIPNSISSNNTTILDTTMIHFEIPWKLQYYHDKGYIAISTSSFKLGDMICSEFPITYTKAWHPFTEQEKETIEKEIQLLSKEHQSVFYEMSNAYPKELPISAGIYMTNSFEMPYYPEIVHTNNHDNNNNEVKMSGMFLAIGRLNHSCTPNVQQTYIPINETTNQTDISNNISNDISSNISSNIRSNNNNYPGYEVLYATRDIAIGDEINDCYIELRQSTEERRKQLYDLYQFHCTCQACCDNNHEDNQRRKRALQLEDVMFQFIQLGELLMAKDIGIELIYLLEHAKSKGWGERYIADACITTSEIMKELNEKKNIRYIYLQKAYEWSLKLTGENSFETKNIMKKIKQLK